MKTVFTTTPFITVFAALSLLLVPGARADDTKILGLDISSAKVVVSSNQFSGQEEELVEELQKVMKEYYVVSKDKWTHDYNHEALSDSTGSIEWTEDATKIWQWMIRPGGLASFTDENGITTYLAKVVN